MVKLPEFIHTKALGCLCTSDEYGSPSGATVFYAVQDEKIYLITHEHSLKAQHIKKNHHVCFVVADIIDYEQIQLYATARIVNDPEHYLHLLGEVINKYSLQTHDLIPYMEIDNQGNAPVVIELTPKNYKYFKSGQGLLEEM